MYTNVAQGPAFPYTSVCAVIRRDLRALLAPKYSEVRGRCRPRGGIAIHPFAAWAPKGGAYAAFATRRLFEEDAAT